MQSLSGVASRGASLEKVAIIWRNKTFMLQKAVAHKLGTKIIFVTDPEFAPLERDSTLGGHATIASGLGKSFVKCRCNATLHSIGTVLPGKTVTILIRLPPRLRHHNGSADCCCGWASVRGSRVSGFTPEIQLDVDFVATRSRFR